MHVFSLILFNSIFFLFSVGLEWDVEVRRQLWASGLFFHVILKTVLRSPGLVTSTFSPTEPSCQPYSNYLAAHEMLVFSFLFFHISDTNTMVRDAYKTTPETPGEDGQGGGHL